MSDVTFVNTDMSVLSPDSVRRLAPNITPLSSFDSETSFDSDIITHLETRRLTSDQLNRLEQRIRTEYDSLIKQEANYRYYIDDVATGKKAAASLEKYPDGTFFVQCADKDEQESNIKYFLVFVSHQRIGRVPICSDEYLRTFWFLSSYGHGSEVQRVYNGIDTLIQDKQENIFFELQYPFRIRLYKPIDNSNINVCIPLPDEIRAKCCRNTILHELVTADLIQYFNELIRISKDDIHRLRDKAQYIVKKINGRNQHGQTPLILAIQSRKYHFIDLLLNCDANVNITDINGCSPVHHACRLADSTSLIKLLGRKADPHYYNPKKMNGTDTANLSAFHYLAMANTALPQSIKRCAMHLEYHDCPLMPLTSDGKSPFDLAEMFDNTAFNCLKNLCNRREFNNIIPIEVSSRDQAKQFLSDLACPNIFSRVRFLFNRIDNSDCCGKNGLFIFYHIKKRENQNQEEYGLCVYNRNNVSIYPISQQYSKTISDPPKKSIYPYSLITDTRYDQQNQIVLFRNFEELIYSYTKYQGILPTRLKDYIKKEKYDISTMSASSLLVQNSRLPIADETEPSNDDINIEQMTHIDRSQIHSIRLVNENTRRFIWLAKVSYQDTNISVIIKDYTPIDNIDTFKEYRYNEIKQNSTLNSNQIFQFSSRTRHEFRREYEILIKDIRYHPFIIHTFICNQQSTRDYRIFMEYLCLGNLHTYLNKIKERSVEPLINVFHWIYQIAQVMGYLSNKKIVHRDLAARNILLKNEKHVKLCDFGLSMKEGILSENNRCIASIRWTAPEYYSQRSNISLSSDIWSFGVLLWEIFTFGSLPYSIEEKKQTKPLVDFLKFYLFESARRLNKPDLCSDSLYDLMWRCWNINEAKRPKFIDIINSFNGTIGANKDCIVTYSRDERHAWKRAKGHYLAIISQSSTGNVDQEYILPHDVESNDNGHQLHVSRM